MSEWIVKQNTDGQLEVVGLLVRCENCKKAKTCERYFTNGLKNGYCDRGEADEIDAAALIKALGIADLPIRLIYEIENAPTIDAVPVRHGKWIHEVRYTIDSLHSYQQYRCSECGMTYITNTNYCPNCGARMDAQ